MLGMTIDPWTLSGLLVFSVVVTLLSNWMAGGFRRPARPRNLSHAIRAVVASAIWILLVFAAGVIATRYIERITNALIGYLIFGGVAVVLSLVRAQLFLRIERQQKPRVKAAQPPWLCHLVHYLSYLLFAIVLYLVSAWLLRRPIELLAFIPLCIGALLPDLAVSRRLEGRLGQREEWHSIAIGLLIALLTLPLARLISLQTWYVIPLGFFSHLILDMLTPQGVILLWPLNPTRYSVFGGPVKSPGSSAERKLVGALAGVAAILLLVVDIGPPPPQPAPAPTNEQTLERYYRMRGRNLVFAYVEGAWQATGRRINGQFEILNAAGESYVMLDRYTGKVFTAGRSGDDNLYLNSIALQAGSSATIKPTEVHLQNQHLADALPVVYQMQREPGLQHIYVSGDVVVPARPGTLDPSLRADYAPTGLRKIQSHEPGHYSLHYLTASELIELANLEVEEADLVIVATYTAPATGPTVTPLPSPPPAAEAAP